MSRRARPVQDIRIWKIQDRRNDPAFRKPWVVRWRVDGRVHNKGWRTFAEADRYRSRLLIAQQEGEWFDPRTGEPESWNPTSGQMQLHVWAREWVTGEWAEWAPRTRATQLEALARFLPLVADPKAPDPPAGLRSHLRATLAPDADTEPTTEHERWLSRWSLTLGELDEAILAEVERRLAIGDEGQALGSSAKRYRKVAHSCIRRAVELKKIPADPWPPTPKGRSQRKVNRKRKAIDVRRLPNPAGMVAILGAITSHQPGSRKYKVMTAVTYYAGLRPSEVVMLRPRALHFPDISDEQAWGWIDVVETDDGYDEAAEPKTGDRVAPMDPDLVPILRAWVTEQELAAGALLFRTRTGKRPSLSNWGRTLKRACGNTGQKLITPYDGRHACATTWLGAGVALGIAAAWLGHSVETLVSYYVGALAGDEETAKTRIRRTRTNGAAAPSDPSHTLLTDQGDPRSTAVKGGEEPSGR